MPRRRPSEAQLPAVPSGETIRRMPEGFAAPPHDMEVEQVLLGTCLVNNLGCHQASRLRPEHFYEPLHGYIWQVITRLVEQGKVATPLTMQAEIEGAMRILNMDREPLRDYLIRLAGITDSVMNVAQYADQIIEFAGRRTLAQLCRDVAAEVNDLTCTKQLTEILAEVRATAEDMALQFEVSAPWKHLTDVIDRKIDELREPPLRYATGVRALDEHLIGGLAAGAVYGIEAASKHFKSGVLGTIALNFINTGVPFLFVALEFDSGRHLERMISAATKMNAVRFRKRQDPDDLISKCLTFRYEHQSAPALFADEPGLSFDRLRSLAAEAVLKAGIKVLFLDYWQLVTGQKKNQSTADHLTKVAQWLATFALKHKVTVIVVSQTNREGLSYQGDGLVKACDWLGKLHKVERRSLAEGKYELMWIEVTHHRDAIPDDIGSAEAPVLRISKHGPVLVDDAPAAM